MYGSQHVVPNVWCWHSRTGCGQQRQRLLACQNIQVHSCCKVPQILSVLYCCTSMTSHLLLLAMRIGIKQQRAAYSAADSTSTSAVNAADGTVSGCVLPTAA